MFRFRKSRARRAEIRRNRPDLRQFWQGLFTAQAMTAIAIALVFWIGASLIVTLRERMVRLRPGQYVHHDVVSRVAFSSVNAQMVSSLQEQARVAAPRVYRPLANAFQQLEELLLSLPEEASTRPGSPLLSGMDANTLAALRQTHADGPDEYRDRVRGFVDSLREARNRGQLIVLSAEDAEQDRLAPGRRFARIRVGNPPGELITVEVRSTLARREAPEKWPQELRLELIGRIEQIASRHFPPALSVKLAAFTVDNLPRTHERDTEGTVAEEADAAASAPLDLARQDYPQSRVIVPAGSTVTPELWKVLHDEHRAYLASLSLAQRLASHLGMAGVILVLTSCLCAYVLFVQPRIARNHARAIAIVALLLAMLLLAQLAGIGRGPLLLFGIAPTILVAMILAIAYDQRFALGVGSLQALLVTLALEQGSGFFFIAWAGVFAASLLLDEVRTRGKLIEVGGMTALALMVAAAAVGAAAVEPAAYVAANSLYAGAAGLGVGFVVLGILPFIEKAFRITTSITLLELADASQPLLKRLSLEAPGTYNHSLQVATLAEAAADAIGAHSLLCRVGSYYHDIGKINKPEYFVENQFDGRNRHLSLSPSVSLLIIIGHVKDGMELAREYNLPTVLMPFIQQHHGTTLVEYFYHQARSQQESDTAAQPVSDVQYRYPGPRPRSRETAVVMIADAVESATRAMVEPTSSRIESLVHDLVMKRLLDGQFDESDLTFEELQTIERTMVKTMLAIYHGRLTYPSAAPAPATAASAVKSA
jgi:putative nucleotidyltransferase with HDIG domain